jgi:hypothetical protein
MRRVTYRTAANAAIFFALWTVIGVVFLWTPIPGALGIRGELFVAWVMLTFLILFAVGVVFLAAAYNAAFPPALQPSPRPAPARAAPRTSVAGRTEPRPAGRPQAGRPQER